MVSSSQGRCSVAWMVRSAWRCCCWSVAVLVEVCLRFRFVRLFSVRGRIVGFAVRRVIVHFFLRQSVMGRGFKGCTVMKWIVRKRVWRLECVVC